MATYDVIGPFASVGSPLPFDQTAITQGQIIALKDGRVAMGAENDARLWIFDPSTSLWSSIQFPFANSAPNKVIALLCLRNGNVVCAVHTSAGQGNGPGLPYHIDMTTLVQTAATFPASAYADNYCELQDGSVLYTQGAGGNFCISPAPVAGLLAFTQGATGVAPVNTLLFVNNIFYSLTGWTVFASLEVGPFYSTDKGLTFNTLSTAYPGFTQSGSGGRGFVLDPVAGNLILFSSNSNAPGEMVFKWNGATWVNWASGLPTFINPRFQAITGAGGLVMNARNGSNQEFTYQSADGGATWQATVGLPASTNGRGWAVTSVSGVQRVFYLYNQGLYMANVTNAGATPSGSLHGRRQHVVYDEAA